MRKQLALGSCLALAMGPSAAHAGSSHQGTSVQGVSVQGVSVQGVSVQGTSVQGTSVQGTSVQGVSIQGTSIQGVSVQGVSIQGTSIQGTSVQGTSIQGSSVQGVSIQGTSIQGVSIQGTSVQGVSIQGVSIQGVGIQGFAPSTAQLPAGGSYANGVFSLLGGALNGETINAALADGSHLTGIVGSSEYFVASDGLVGAAFAYYPNGDANELPLIVFVRDYAVDADTNAMLSGVDPLNGDNSDVHLYRLTAPMLVLDEVTDGEGNTSIQPVGYVELNLCGSDEDGVTPDDFGIFFEGVPNLDGSMTAGGHSFSCRSGTMNKAARAFGYKPWKDFSVAESGYALWNAMWNGAMANYCGDVTNSFTVNGTLIDVEDIYGLNLKTAENDAFAFAPESDWSSATAGISHFYANRIGYDPDGLNNYTCAETGLHEGEIVASLDSGIRIHTSKICMHPASETGTPLNRDCNPCTRLVADAPGTNPMCFSHAWFPECVAAATALCAPDAETADATGYNSGTGNLSLSL